VLDREVRLERGRRRRPPSRAPGAALPQAVRGSPESLLAEGRQSREAQLGDPDEARGYPRHRPCRRRQSPVQHRSAAGRGRDRSRRRFQSRTAGASAASPPSRGQPTSVRLCSRSSEYRCQTGPPGRKTFAWAEKKSAPDRIRTCDLRFRRPCRVFALARLSSGFGSTPGLEFVWVRLVSVPSVALLLPSWRPWPAR
jgi:hypothetical protein